MGEKEQLKQAAEDLKNHCKKNNFYASGDGLCHCVFVEGNECCPFEGGGIPEDWEV